MHNEAKKMHCVKHHSGRCCCHCCCSLWVMVEYIFVVLTNNTTDTCLSSLWSTNSTNTFFSFSCVYVHVCMCMYVCVCVCIYFFLLVNMWICLILFCQFSFVLFPSYYLHLCIYLIMSSFYSFLYYFHYLSAHLCTCLPFSMSTYIKFLHKHFPCIHKKILACFVAMVWMYVCACISCVYVRLSVMSGYGRQLLSSAMKTDIVEAAEEARTARLSESDATSRRSSYVRRPVRRTLSGRSQVSMVRPSCLVPCCCL